MSFPASFVGAVVRISVEEARITEFCGSAALLRDSLLLTARHVADDAVTGAGEPCLVVFDSATGRNRRAVIEAVEPHPDRRVDLALGRFGWVEGTGRSVAIGRPFAGWGLASGWTDVKIFGFPDELVGPTDFVAYRFDGRFLKGYVTRTLEPGEHFQVESRALELSFAIPKGMSGAPVFIEAGDARNICGIATGSVEVAVIRHRSLAELEDGQPRLEERVERVVEAGIAVRTSFYLDWRANILEGETLGDVLAVKDQ
jgi:Trypsin-like peptidase domain